jgi:hypothetical protein
LKVFAHNLIKELLKELREPLTYIERLGAALKGPAAKVLAMVVAA